MLAMIFVNINWTICRRILRFLSITFLSMSWRVLRRSPSTELLELPQRYTTRSYGGPMPNCSPQFLLAHLPFLVLFEYQTPFITLLYTIRYPNSHLHYGCFRIFTSEDGWVANGQKRPRGWWRERTALFHVEGLDESLRFECYCET